MTLSDFVFAGAIVGAFGSFFYFAVLAK